MHTRHIDLARATTTACYRDDAANDSTRLSPFWWCAVAFAAWCGVIAWWL
jgi:hypothetical protein